MTDDLDGYVIPGRESLVTRRPGESAASKAKELAAASPVRTFLARVLDRYTDERAWRRGAAGEVRTAQLLARLVSTGWHLFHDIPIGERGANVDHVVIGPGGVYALNTKNLTGKVWVAERTFMHNGHRTDYLPKSHREGERIGACLSSAIGLPVAVTPVLVVFCDELTIKAQPLDVAVVEARGIRPWLEARPHTLDAATAFHIAGKADDPATWSRR
jgi:hypothetical protein